MQRGREWKWERASREREERDYYYYYYYYVLLFLYIIFDYYYSYPDVLLLWYREQRGRERESSWVQRGRKKESSYQRCSAPEILLLLLLFFYYLIIIILYPLLLLSTACKRMQCTNVKRKRDEWKRKRERWEREKEREREAQNDKRGERKERAHPEREATPAECSWASESLERGVPEKLTPKREPYKEIEREKKKKCPERQMFQSEEWKSLTQERWSERVPCRLSHTATPSTGMGRILQSPTLLTFLPAWLSIINGSHIMLLLFAHIYVYICLSK